METVKVKNVVTERDHVAGAQNAAVTLLEYGNFECVHCGRAYPIIKEVQKTAGRQFALCLSALSDSANSSAFVARR